MKGLGLALIGSLAAAACGAVQGRSGTGTGDDAGGDPGSDPYTPPSDALVWPNAQSSANSDPWLVQNHDRITRLRPRVLAINFVDRTARDGVVTDNRLMHELDADLVAALAAGSTYHGYQHPEAVPYLEYELVEEVDLGDRGSPPAGWSHLNSSRYPFKCDASAPYQFDYAALFTQAYADLYGIADPGQPGHNLTLCELIQRGQVNEVWLGVNGDPDPFTCANGVRVPDFQLPEVVELKQKYDAQGGALRGQMEPCAGNGCLASDDAAALAACGRSIRLLYINETRGVGCAVHSLGHGIEWTATSDAVPAFSAGFVPFANLDLNRFGASFPPSAYDISCPADSPLCISYPTDNAMAFPYGTGTLTASPLDQGCGNVHFPPNARGNYDDHNPQAVRSTCESFGLGTGKDRPLPYTDAKSQRYDGIAPDCEGGWQVYWRQSFPGFATTAAGRDRAPLRNWWPYLFY
jgi:hypothetical protein